MKCKHCNGTGEVEVVGDSVTDICDKCGGTGKITKKDSVTNEEWFNTLSTEEKAKRIINIAVNSDCDYRTIVEWLKQPHQGE